MESERYDFVWIMIHDDVAIRQQSLPESRKINGMIRKMTMMHYDYDNVKGLPSNILPLLQLSLVYFGKLYVPCVRTATLMKPDVTLMVSTRRWSAETF